MTNGEQEESYPIPIGNSSLYFYSITDFLLLPTRYSGLGGVSYDVGKKDITMVVTYNFNFLSFISPSNIDSL